MRSAAPQHATGGARRREAGYAMLLVFLMAALLAISLYMEFPRVAFESQRAKEQLLIERGEQYKRAIQLFVRKVNRYPATIEELESTNNIRFLRKRYLDPMTGKDKWRLIHINGGVLTDSIIQKGQPGQAQPQGNTNTFIGEGPVMGATTDPNQQQINPGMRRRASDDKPTMTQEVPDTPQQDAESNAEAADSETPNDDAPAPGTLGATGTTPVQPAPNMPPGRPPFPPGMMPPGMNPSGAFQPGYGGRVPGQPGMGGQPGMVGSQPYMPGSQTGQDDTSSQGGFPQPSYPGQPASTGGTVTGGMYPQQPGMYPQQPGMNPQQPGTYPQQPGAFPGQQPGVYPQQSGMSPQQGFGQPAAPAFGGNGMGSTPNGPSSAAQMINNSLMGPRPGGMAGLPGMGGTQMGGGIAGVASESKGPAIIVYNERKKYNEWEFVYDQSKDKGLAGVTRGGGAPGTPAGQMGSMPGSPVGGQQAGGTFGGSSFGNSGASPFGSSSFGSGTGSSFGQTSTGFGQSPQQQPPPQAPQQPQN